jgi:glycosyltransferase involved in cell wall biosynthesis
MRILFDSEIFSCQPYGGISRYFVKLASALNSQGVDSRILAGVHVNKYIDSNHWTIGLRFPNVRGLPRLAWPVNDTLRACYSRWAPPDILHKTYYGNHLWQPKSKVVITIYDMIWERWRGVDHPVSRAKAHWIERADAVVAISEFTRADLLEIYKVPESKVKVIHLACGDLPDRSDAAAAPKDSYILHVGGRGWYKNFDRFVRAYAASTILKREFRVFCFGGKFSAQERRLFSDLGVLERMVHVQGEDSMLAAYYRNARAHVVPSLAEGFGLTVLEAMKCGCPVICSDTTSLPEVAGAAGIYFDPREEDAIRSTLEAALFDNEVLGAKAELGRVRAAQFSWSKCATDTKSLYTSVCGRATY